jgi:hypothetical protein
MQPVRSELQQGQMKVNKSEAVLRSIADETRQADLCGSDYIKGGGQCPDTHQEHSREVRGWIKYP